MQAKQITISKTNDTSSPLLNVNLMDSATEDIKKELSGSKIGLIAIQVSDKKIYESTIYCKPIDGYKTAFCKFIGDCVEPYVNEGDMSMIKVFVFSKSCEYIQSDDSMRVVVSALPAGCTVILNFWTAPE